MAPISGNDPPARLIDLSRLASRAGRGLTGVDRVERAYLAELLSRDTPLFALLRTPAGYLLLDRAGAAACLARIDAGDFGRPDLLSRLGRGRPDAVRALEARLRAGALARSLRNGLGRMLRRHLPAGTAYLNLGHTNLTERVVDALRALPGGRIAVFLHDTIPLDHPGLQRPGSAGRFRGHLARAAAADVILTSSEAAAADIRRHLGPAAPPIAAAPLGVDVPADIAPADLPPGVDVARPFFVALGTIEPRKNVGLLLDAWERLGPAPPPLYLVGARGWETPETFARLDAAAARGVRVLPGLGDRQAAALVAGARALLFPSLAEGFGLPPLEAAALGTRPVCADLAVCRELLGDVGIYLPTGDVYAWVNTIEQLTEQDDPGSRVHFDPPRWAAHFKVTLNVT